MVLSRDYGLVDLARAHNSGHVPSFAASEIPIYEVHSRTSPLAIPALSSSSYNGLLLACQ